MTRRIVLGLEDGADRTAAMRRVVAELDGYELVVFMTAAECNAWLAEHADEIALLSLDFHLGPAARVGSGLDVARIVATRTPSFPVILHTSDGTGAMAMREVLVAGGWQIARLIFNEGEWRRTARRLLGVDV